MHFGLSQYPIIWMIFDSKFNALFVQEKKNLKK